MSIYTENIKTQFIDPVHHSNKRCEMRLLTGKQYLTNLRVCGLGCTVDNQAVDVDYNKIGGVKSLIKNAHLMDGNVVIDQLVNVNKYCSFKNYNKTNQKASDFKALDKSGMGFIYSKDADEETSSTQALRVREFNEAHGLPSEIASQTPQAWIDLKDLFPVLKSLQFIDTTVFKNLRVVLEFDSSVNALTAGGMPQVKVVQILQPLLVADEVLMPVQSSSSVVWNAIESDSTVLPQGSTSKTFRFNGFNSKRVSAVLLQKEPTTSKSGFYQSLGSVAMKNEQIMVRVDGADALPVPMNKANARLALLRDTFGNTNSYPCVNSLSMYNPVAFVKDSANRLQHLDYFGCSIGSPNPIKDLQLVYQREPSNDSFYVQELKLNLWGVVSKSIIVKPDGSYTVQYN
jgi:hypothetical protein